jgi:hypothetical protein
MRHFGYTRGSTGWRVWLFGLSVRYWVGGWWFIGPRLVYRAGQGFLPRWSPECTKSH